MKITLPHQTTQPEAIQKIDRKLNEAMAMDFPAGVRIIDPYKKWNGNIMNFSFTVQRFILSLDFEGTVIVTDQEVIGEADIPGIVTTFFSEETIKGVIRQQFNQLFNIR
ncbi:MAG: hypothetical protein WC508_00785 [Patescibacteria group bacterium]